MLPVGGHAKVVNPAEAIFSQDIRNATYIAYSSDRNVVGFQLNGTADWVMLDGLPALGNTNTASPPGLNETLFVSSNAWRGSLPPNTETVTPDEFRSRQEAGDLQVITPDAQQAQRTVRQRRVEAELVFLESKSDISDEVKVLLGQARSATDLEGGSVATLPGGQKVALIDLGSRIEKAAENYRLAHDPVNALATYSLSYSLLSDAQKAQVQAPATLQGGTLEQIKQATQQMNAVLATTVNLDNVRLDPNAPPTSLHLLNAGNGVDNNGNCTPAGYAKRYWFPLRSFISPVKDQGESAEPVGRSLLSRQWKAASVCRTIIRRTSPNSFSSTRSSANGPRTISSTAALLPLR